VYWECLNAKQGRRKKKETKGYGVTFLAQSSGGGMRGGCLYPLWRRKIRSRFNTKQEKGIPSSADGGKGKKGGKKRLPTRPVLQISHGSFQWRDRRRTGGRGEGEKKGQRVARFGNVLENQKAGC